MAQNYTEIADTQTLQNSRSLLLDNDKTAISNSSGTSFPTANLLLGMGCYRTDAGQDIMYILKDVGNQTWEKISAGDLWDDSLNDGSKLLASQFVRSDAADTISGALTLIAQTTTFSNNGAEILMDGSGNSALRRITNNDGGGNWNFRSGNRFDVSEIYNNTGDGAAHLKIMTDGVNGSIDLRVAAAGTAGNTVSWAQTLSLDTNGLTRNGNTIYDSANFVAGTDYQPADAQLTDIAGLTPSTGNLIVGNGSNFVSETVGANNQVLVADSAQGTGMKWASQAPDATTWDGATKTVSTGSPSGGSNGDIWFQYA